MEVDEAYSLIAAAIDASRAANGYLVVGNVRGNCAELLRRILRKLFPAALAQVEAGEHPDIVQVEPEGKLRIIKVETVKERLVEAFATTAYSGGWKVGVVHCAERLAVRAEAANAFLKILEEPPPKTMFFLLTDNPEGLLPTIVSRCQRIDLPLASGLLTGADYEGVAEVFRSVGVKGVAEKALAARHLAQVLADLKEAAEDADVPLVRKAFYKTILSFVRNWMVEGKLPLYRARNNLDAVEEAYRQSERSMSDEAVLAFMMDRMVFP